MIQPNLPLQDLASSAATGLRAAFHVDADIIVAAPGRVNLIGEHIDYCDGFVMPFAIERYIVIAAKKNDGDVARIFSEIGGVAVEFSVAEKLEEGGPSWTNYIRGVMRGFQERGCTIPGFDAYIVSSLPLGAGLSSSAALECATATLLEGWLQTGMSARDKALLCQKAEHDFAHVPCGIMDQFASVFGETDRLVLIDCMTGEPQLVPFENADLTVIIANTMVSHQLSDGGYSARRDNTIDGLKMLGFDSWRDVPMSAVDDAWYILGDPVNRRARHVVGEISRTQNAAEMLERGDYEKLGELMQGSHDSLRDDFEVSCAELDLLVSIAQKMGRAGGVIGARMTGGGFGGSTVTLCETAKAESIVQKLLLDYKAATGISAEIFVSRPAKGAHVVGRVKGFASRDETANY